MRAAVQLAVGFAVVAFVASAAAQTPLPRTTQGRSVYDTAGVISQTHVAVMERAHAELRNKAGVSIAVVTVPQLDAADSIEEFAVRFGHERGVGRKGEDRGIVVALSVRDRRIFVATGYGVEGYLPDGKVGRFIDEYAVPHLRGNDFSSGLTNLSLGLVQASAQEFQVAVTGQPQVTRRRPRRRAPGMADLILGIIAGIGFLYMAIRHPRLLFWILLSGRLSGRRGGGGFGGGGFWGGGGFGGFGCGGFCGGGAGRGF